MLLFVAFLDAPHWYLAARGKQATATVEAPLRTWERGARIAYCRVRLPTGKVRQVDRNDATCANNEGATVPMVYDPSGHVAPVLGAGRGGLGGAGLPGAVGAGVVLLGTAVTAVAGAVRRREHQ